MSATINVFEEVLVSERSSAELASDSDVYGWLIGSWDVRVVDCEEAGKPIETRGEWHFARVLEGRAVQDVFIVPARARRSADTPRERNRYGMSIRVYDPESQAWRVTWLNPVRNVRNELTGRRIGAEIIQEGRDPDGALIRWSFRDIKTDSFRWTGEKSIDNGKTWQLGAEFFATRTR